MPKVRRNDPIAYRRALLDADNEDPMDDEHLESELVQSFDCATDPTQLDTTATPAALFYASWLVEMEVGNGGFGQFALNAYEWFSLAARGYDALGLPEVAEAIRAAHAVAKSEEAQIFDARGGDVYAASRYFTGTALEPFDEHYDSLCVTAERVAFARAHRHDFG